MKLSAVTIPDEFHARIAEFKQVVEAILDEVVTFEHCVALILDRGLYGMLNDIIGALSPEILQDSIQQLGARHPAARAALLARSVRTVRRRRRGRRRQLRVRDCVAMTVPTKA